jgi:hypothetical protein
MTASRCSGRDGHQFRAASASIDLGAGTRLPSTIPRDRNPGQRCGKSWPQWKIHAYYLLGQRLARSVFCGTHVTRHVLQEPVYGCPAQSDNERSSPCWASSAEAVRRRTVAPRARPNQLSGRRTVLRPFGSRFLRLVGRVCHRAANGVRSGLPNVTSLPPLANDTSVPRQFREARP